MVNPREIAETAEEELTERKKKSVDWMKANLKQSGFAPAVTDKIALVLQRGSAVVVPPNGFHSFLRLTGSISVMRGTRLLEICHCEYDSKLEKISVHPFETDTKGRHSSWLTFLLTG